MADRRHNKGGASALPTVGCIVAQMAAEYARLAADFARMDGAQFADPADRDVKAESLDRLEWRMAAIEDGMTAMQATSIEGALAQLAIASSLAESYHTSVLTAAAAEREQAIPRLLYSAVTAVAAHHGIDPTDALFARLMPVRLDPFGEVRHVA